MEKKIQGQKLLNGQRKEEKGKDVGIKRKLAKLNARVILDMMDITRTLAQLFRWRILPDI